LVEREDFLDPSGEQSANDRNEASENGSKGNQETEDQAGNTTTEGYDGKLEKPEVLPDPLEVDDQNDEDSRTEEAVDYPIENNIIHVNSSQEYDNSDQSHTTKKSEENEMSDTDRINRPDILRFQSTAITTHVSLIITTKTHNQRDLNQESDAENYEASTGLL